MKIAVIAPTHIPARRANTIQVMKMAQALALLGHTVRVSTPAEQPAETVPWQDLASLYGLTVAFPVEWIPCRAGWRRYDYGWRSVQWARDWSAQLIYTRLPQAAALSSLVGIPTLLEVHDLPRGLMGQWLFGLFLRGRGARRLVVITRALLQDLVQLFNVPADPSFTLLAPDGVDLLRYQHLPEPCPARQALQAELPDLQPERFTAGYSGHLYEGRGSEQLLLLAQRLPGITFLLVGGEPQEVQRLRQQTRSLGLANVILTGFVDNAWLPRYQAACDVLLMPYQARVAASSGGNIARYLSPMKLFEYLACGRPIVSSDLPVLQEVLHPGNALLVPGQDLSAWQVALEQLQSDPDLCRRLGTAAQQEARQYSWEERASRICSFDL